MKHSSVKIYPSLIAGDFGAFSDEAKRVADSGAQGLHLDIMDGNFVPNITLGIKTVEAVRKAAPSLFLDVHIMVYHPMHYIEQLVSYGADAISFHFEATEDVSDLLRFIKKCNIKAGLAFNPDTSKSFIDAHILECDQILIMTVKPGFGGQAFMPDMLDKIEHTRQFFNHVNKDKGRALDIIVDGGIDDVTANECYQKGANIFVSGTYLFNGKMQDKVHALRETIK